MSLPMIIIIPLSYRELAHNCVHGTALSIDFLIIENILHNSRGRETALINLDLIIEKIMSMQSLIDYNSGDKFDILSEHPGNEILERSAECKWKIYSQR
jgi:hypothetical protein